MLILPAIDIIGGKCVRLTQGDFSRAKIYEASPAASARRFTKEGAQTLHIVDLDGARSGKPRNMTAILRIAAAVHIPIQVGGGIRTASAASRYLENGVERIVMGTQAVEKPDLLRSLIRRYGADRIVVSIDVRHKRISVRGWQKASGLSPSSLAEKLRDLGIKKVIVTDIERDGMLAAPRTLTARKLYQLGFYVIVAGGVSNVETIARLARENMYGAIIGKALYEGKIRLAEALAAAQPRSTLAKRIIPCLDVKNGRTVKGVNFFNLCDAGSPVSLAEKYARAGSDELVFLDIAATREKRSTMTKLVRRVAEKIFIPFAVGGGISSIDDIRAVLAAGADKVSINSAAVTNPRLITKAARIFGSQSIIVAIDAKKQNGVYSVVTEGGTRETMREAVGWAREIERRGAGEILLTSMDRDGTKKGFDCELVAAVARAVSIPVIASGGAGSLKDFADAFNAGADACLAASVFHYNKTSIPAVKKYLAHKHFPIRL